MQTRALSHASHSAVFPGGCVTSSPQTVDEMVATPRPGNKAAPTKVCPGSQQAVPSTGKAGGSTCTTERQDKDTFAGRATQTQLHSQTVQAIAKVIQRGRATRDLEK